MIVVHLPLDKKKVKIRKGELKEWIKKEKVRPFFGCEAGLCGTCVSTVTKGLEYLPSASEREMRTLRRIQAKANQRLVCQLEPEKNCTILPQYADAAKREWIEPQGNGFKSIWVDRRHKPEEFMFD